jgi:hypothetical protein
MFQKLDLFLSSGDWGGGKTPTLLGPLEGANLYHRTRLALSKGPNGVGVSPSPEDGNKPSFQNVLSSF